MATERGIIHRAHPSTSSANVWEDNMHEAHKSIGWHLSGFSFRHSHRGTFKGNIRLSQEFQHHKLHLYVLDLGHACVLNQSNRNFVSWVWQLIKFLPLEFQYFHLLYVQMCGFILSACTQENKGFCTVVSESRL